MIEFPVSSGNAHRVKEVDVDPMKDLIGDTAIKAIEDKSEPAKKEESEEPESKTPEPTEAEKFNNTNPLGVIMFGGMPEPPKALEAPKPVTPVETKKGTELGQSIGFDFVPDCRFSIQIETFCQYII